MNPTKKGIGKKEIGDVEKTVISNYRFGMSTLVSKNIEYLSEA